MGESTPSSSVYKLGDVVENVNEYYDRRSPEPERYAAGDHTDEGSLSVRRWGLTSDGMFPPTFNRRFRAGDVLFHSRNLRKLVQPSFDGVTGEKLFVLRVTRPDLLLPSILPFLLQTAQFDDYVNRMWAGSTNKFLNKTPLMRYELVFPPLEEQRRVAKVLESVRALSDALAALDEGCNRVLSSAAAHEFDRLRSSSIASVPLGSICSQKPQSGIYKSEEFRGRGVRMVNMGELFSHDTIGSTIEMERIDLDETELQRYALTSHDLLFGRRSVVLEGAGRCVLVGDLTEPVVFESSVLRATIDSEQADSRYVFEWLRSPHGHQQIRRIVTFTTVSGVAGSDVARLLVPLPALAVQRQVADWLSSVRIQADAPRKRHAESVKLASVVAQRTLGGIA